MRRPSTCLSELQLATLLQYSADGSSEASRVSKETVIRMLHRSARQRPSPEEHIKTMSAESAFRVRGKQLTLVDDVVSRGSTLLAAATLLRRVFPKMTIVAFAAVRTMSKVEVDQMWPR